ncbi:MAG: type III-A CRISPR-associated protein Csm2 [Deltaproteobacteria bacterium]|nr:type III-A CRISPR-associated protein Csm2 [Deltaproteobacteria bacterium]
MNRADCVERAKNINWGQYAKEIQNLHSIASERLVELSDDIGCALSTTIKMNQIRRFLDSLRRIEHNYNDMKYQEDPQREELKKGIKHNLTMLRPKLAYAVGRTDPKKDEGKAFRNLMIVLEPAIQAAARDPENVFEKLLRFMESIIAYHRFYGGGN